eukprot:scaffold7504_cov121-Isochrysis_galbana.AAC.14
MVVVVVVDAMMQVWGRRGRVQLDGEKAACQKRGPGIQKGGPGGGWVDWCDVERRRGRRDQGVGGVRGMWLLHRSKQRRGPGPLFIGRAEPRHRVDDGGTEERGQDAHGKQVTERLGEKIGTCAVRTWE